MKAWQKPQLIVLVRNRPEEAILTFCKGDSSGTDSQSTNMGCWGVGAPPLASLCTFCYTPGVS
jgi:hypothetical protein